MVVEIVEGWWNGALLVSVLLHAELGLSEASFHSSESAGDHYYCVRIDATQYCCLKATDFFLMPMTYLI